ncbi:MAG: glycosyltransferase [Candidatus ainarchaeum sp.]|nr:glycosyltransferase [Candidatus ainarchaeum sp.]
MKICFIVDAYYPSIDGAATSIRNFKAELERKGHNVYVICPRYPGYKDTEKNIIRIRSFKVPKAAGYRLAIPLSTLEKIFKKEKFDLIHLHSFFTLGQKALKLTKKYGIPVVGTYHTQFVDYVPGYYKIFSKALQKVAKRVIVNFYGKCDVTLAPSPQSKKILEDYGVGSKIVVLPTGIIIDQFKGGDGERFKKKYGLKKEKILLFVGRVGHEKNISFLIKALKKIIEKQKNVVLAIVGDGVARKSLELLTKKLGLEGKVLFTGFLDKQNLADAYAACTIFTFASLTDTQGIVLLEAMSAGKPVVAIKAHGVIDVLDKEGGGLLAKNNVSDFSEKTLLLLNGKTLYTKKQKGAKERAKEMSIQNKTKELIAVYNSLMKKKAK